MGIEAAVISALVIAIKAAPGVFAALSPEVRTNEELAKALEAEGISHGRLLDAIARAEAEGR